MAGPSSTKLGINDLDDVISTLKRSDFPADRWDELGLKLHISQPMRDAVKAYNNPRGVNSCLKECLSLWLQQDYDVDTYGLPTLELLAAAIEEMGLRAVAKGINQESTQSLEDTDYAGVLFYEEKGVEDLVTFTVAKDKDTILEYIQRKHPQAEIGQTISFTLIGDYIELKFDAPQDKPTTGWTIEPHTVRCKIYRDDVDRYGEPGYSIPPSCRISVYGSLDDVPTLHYAIPVEGVVEPVTLYIHRSMIRGNERSPKTPSALKVSFWKRYTREITIFCIIIIIIIAMLLITK